MPPSKKTSSSKKGGKKKAAASASSATSSTAKVPRSNEEIIGNTWKNNVIKKSVVRELNEALVYESTSEKRKEVMSKLDALEGTSVTETGATDITLMPATYETQPMLNYPKMPFMLYESCWSTMSGLKLRSK